MQEEKSIHTVKISGSIAAKVQTMLRISGGNFGNRVIIGRISCSLSKDSRKKERLSMAIVRSWIYLLIWYSVMLDVDSEFDVCCCSGTDWLGGRIA